MTTKQTKQTKQTIERIHAIQANAGPSVSDDMLERLLGVEHALLLTLEKNNYVDRWMADSADKIRFFHSTIRTGCGCGVCRQEWAAAVAK